jgi:hypothetical protein
MVQKVMPMKSMTIHNIDDQLEELLTDKSKELGLSMNKTIKYLLRVSLGLDQCSEEKKKARFEDLFGCWTDEDLREFNENTKVFSEIDEDEWKQHHMNRDLTLLPMINISNHSPDC